MLQTIAKCAAVATYRKGDPVLYRDERSDGLLIVRSGVLKLPLPKLESRAFGECRQRYLELRLVTSSARSSLHRP